MCKQVIDSSEQVIPPFILMFHSVWLDSMGTEGGPALLDGAARAFQPNTASYFIEEELNEPIHSDGTKLCQFV